MKTFTQTLCVIFLLLCASTAALAQQKGLVHGLVQDQHNEPLPFVNVSLLAADTDQLIAGAVTDASGKFKITTEQSGSMKLMISFIGFQTLKTAPFELQKGKIQSFEGIILEEEMINLGEVVVTAARPDIVVEPDKTIVNVEGTVLAEGNTTLDVIARSPGIFIDQDDNINLNGRSGVTVMINDRQTYMTGTELTNFLRAMPAENIKSIEIINNPPARFDAEGAAGIINIQLKKNNIDGMFGNVQIGSMYNGSYSPNAGVTVNLKKGKWTNTANLNFNEYNYINFLDIERNFQVAEGVSNFVQDSRIDDNNRNLFFKIGSDYEINENHSVGINVFAADYNGLGIGNSITAINNPGTTDVTSIRSFNDNDQRAQNLFANFHYVGKLDTLGTKISTDFDFSRRNSASNSLMTNTAWVNQNEAAADKNYIQTLNDMYYNIFTAKVDFTKPLGEGKVFEAGVKGSWVFSDNELNLSRAAGEEEFEIDPNSNHFLYEENVLAAYANYKSQFSEKVNFQVGLRAESSDIRGTSLTLDRVDQQQYVNLFPSVYVQQQVTPDYQIIYNANRRISRPNYRLLNPFVYFIDPFTSERGNPALRPQYAHNLEMNHIIKGAYQFTLSYSLTTDVFQQIFTQDEETRSTTTFNANLDQAQNWSFRAMVPVEIRPWWNANNMLQVKNAQWKSMIGDALLDVSLTSFTLRTQHTFTLPGGLKAELMGMYLSREQYGQATINGFGWVDAGFTKSMMKDKLSVSVNATDLFASQRIFANVTFDNIDTNFQQYRSTQGVRVTLRYKFSQGESFRASNRSGNTEEQNRLN